VPFPSLSKAILSIITPLASSCVPPHGQDALQVHRPRVGWRGKPYYFNARWYDPELGRFYSLDPLREGTNPYVYAGDNP